MAHSVFTGVIQSARHLGWNLFHCKATIEGFGNVGRPLAVLLDKVGIPVVAISTSRGCLYHPRGLKVDHLVQLGHKVGSQVVEFYRVAEFMKREALFELPIDILYPCARWNSIQVENESCIQAKIISPGANNPITPEAEQILFKRGVLCLPDFVSNCGGVLGGTMEFASVRRDQIMTFIGHHIGEIISWLLKEAKTQNVLPRIGASQLAQKRFEQIQQRTEHPPLLGWLFNMELELYRRG